MPKNKDEEYIKWQVLVKQETELKDSIAKATTDLSRHAIGSPYRVEHEEYLQALKNTLEFLQEQMKELESTLTK